MKEFGTEGVIYRSRCPECGAVLEVEGLPDNRPEYYLNIRVRCQVCETTPAGCAEFSLPVN